MDKRRLISQLPGVHQTETLKKFFGATVDQLFQPGRAEPLSGYIGSRPSYYDASKDFYVAEPTASRAAHQLEPALTSRNADGEITNLLFYDDYVNYLRTNNAKINDHNRLFAGQYYSWAPPVDLDKINNFQQYYWFGGDVFELPAQHLTAGSTTTIASGAGRTFPLPETLDGLDASAETHIAFVGTSAAIIASSTATDVELLNTPPAGAEVVVFRYGDLKRVIEGRAQFDATLFGGQTTTLTNGMHLVLHDALSLYTGLEARPFEAVILSDREVDVRWDEQTRLRNFWVEGANASIKLVEVNHRYEPVSSNPPYVTISRASRDQNPWSRNNYWVHADSIAWSGQTFPSYRATRPIVEFLPNIELYDYGTNRMDDVTVVLSGDPLYQPDPAQPPYAIPLSQANGKLPGTLFIDSFEPVRFGDRILVLANDDEDLVNRIITVRAALDTSVVNGVPVTQEVMVLEVSPLPQKGDVTRLAVQGFVPWDQTSRSYDQDPFEYSTLAIEYWFTGIAWNEGQKRNVANPDPLFMLYTDTRTSHTKLMNPAFAGNRLFGYASGATLDSVLGRYVRHDSYGQLVFENDAVTRRTVANGQEVQGWQFYRIVGETAADDTYSNGWYPAVERSNQTLTAEGVFSLPVNLTANADNEEVTFISRSQWFDHFTSIIASQTGFAGSPYALNNWRDTAKDPSLGQHILQHRSPLLKPMLLASDKRFDYFDATRYVDQEYARFRAKFLQQVLEIQKTGQRTDADSPDVWVETALTNLRRAKTNGFPFALSNLAGGQYFIPPTPAAMGMLPVVEPGLESDDTYSETVSMIRGHDGSRTPAFGDIRDTMLLALERRIYRYIQTTFKDESFGPFSLWNSWPGRSRPQGYRSFTREEVTDMLTPIFLRWAQQNGFDYRANTGYEPNDPFTWNYRGLPDRDNNPLPGHWRAIYRHYFDTDRPHTAPWEMQGFATKPSWWDSEYGVAPYTRGNWHLWEDIRDGRIARGSRAGLDPRFARPDIFDVCPVDADGNLLDPVAAQIVKATPRYQQATRKWVIGDHGPVENLWINSPAYRFALAHIAALMRPSQWIESYWDTTNSVRLRTQFYNAATQNRPRSAQLNVHGEIDATTGQRIALMGVQQWISDLMVSRGQNPSILGDAVRGIEVRLAHKMAGFTQPNNLRVFADNFGMVPQEDVEVVYHQSPPIRESVYSGVIVEWTGEGWIVVGYDNTAEHFKIMPGDVGGPKSVISLGDEPVIYEWRGNVYYPLDRYVSYKGTTYRCVLAHTSGRAFEDEYWVADPQANKEFPRVVVSDRGTGDVVRVPYGTLFTTRQEVGEFLRCYSRWLEAEGWVFNSVEPSTGDLRTWDVAIRDFLQWTQMQWQPGNFIALSPAASDLTFKAVHGTVYNIEEPANGVYGLLDRTGRPLPQRATFVSRLDDETKVITTTEDLFGARVRVGEIEHVLVFSNLTIFNDIIYQPLFNLRQPRLRLIGMRSSDWKGRRDAPGYAIDGNDLRANFVSASDNVRNMFEIERSDDRDMRDHARHLVGYQTRTYLDNLLLSETQQFEFFQGMIQQKGAPGAFQKLSRSHFIDQDRDLKFMEEWGLHVGRYGAVANSHDVSFNLYRSDIRSNPQLIRFGRRHDNDGIVGIADTDERWIARPDDTFNVFPTRNDPVDFRATPGWDIYAFDVPKRSFDPLPIAGGPEVRVRGRFLPTAGYVRVDEIDLAVFRPTLFSALYASASGTPNYIRTGSRVWLYDKGDGGFDVLEGFSIAALDLQDKDIGTNKLAQIETFTEDETLVDEVRLVFTERHGLIDADVGLYIVLGGQTLTEPNIEGIHRITIIETPTAIRINASALKGYNDFALNDDYAVPVTLLRSMRFADRAAAQVFWTRFVPPLGQTVYVDDDGSGLWAVYAWDGTSWKVARQQPQRIDVERVEKALVYDLKTKVTNKALTAEPVLIDGLTVLDPVSGYIPGVAEREITYKVDYDPARYLAGSDDLWGNAQVGQLWWDLGSVRFLETHTDIITSNVTSRTLAEISYRVKNWARVAPGSSVDVYEWTRSLKVPDPAKLAMFTRGGDDEPIWIERSEFDAAMGRNVTAYYYWLRNPTTVPNMAGRSLSANQVAELILNPKSNDLPWVAPILPNGLLVGGIDQYLNDDSSVFQITVTDRDYEGVVHNEWQLVRPNDDRISVPDSLWQRLRDSLVGFDDLGQPVPDPNLPERLRTGTAVRPRQSLFAGGKDGMLAARRSFVSKLNAMLARTDLIASNPAIVTALTKATPSFENLIWTQSSGSTDSIVFPPPKAYDFEVDRSERNALLVDRRADMVRFRNRTGRNPRILVTNYLSTYASWSIWEFDVTVPAAPNPDPALTLMKSYTKTAPTLQKARIDAAAGIYAVGERVHILSDSSVAGMWATRVFQPTAANPIALNVVDIQTYRTTDFWQRVDWYASGYSAANGPVARYATLEARNVAEMPNPKNTFVRVDDDGAGRWIWTAYADGNWSVVARQNGTIALSSDLYDPARLTLTLNDISVASQREGSRDLRALIDALLNEVLTNAEKNELFFSMLHFVHTQQDAVPWAFKTSFLSLLGFNEALGQTPIQTYDNTENLLDYIDEVKPYRVKTRDFARTLTPDIDPASVHVTDFDKPLYFDDYLDRYRQLLLTSPSDLQVLSTQQPWIEWFSNYTKMDTDPASANYNPVRKLNLRLRFDRIDPSEELASSAYGWDRNALDYGRFDDVLDQLEGSSGSALARLLAFYMPTEDMREKNPTELLGLDFAGIEIEGSELYVPTLPDLSVWDIHPYDADTLDKRIPVTKDVILDAEADLTQEVSLNPNGTGRSYGLTDPYHSDDHAQEFLSTHANDGSAIIVNTAWTAGAPNQYTSYVNTSRIRTANVRLSYSQVASSAQAVHVFRDGQRAVEGTDYTIDHFTRVVTVQLGSPRAKTVMVHIFGPAGLTTVREQHFFQGDGSTRTYPMNGDVGTGWVDVVVNGVRLSTDQIAVDGSQVTLASAPIAQADVMVMIFEPTLAGTSPVTTVNHEVLDYSAGPSWTLANPTTNNSAGELDGTIVEVDGYRLIPTTDYTISGGVLTISKALTASSRIEATTFTNADLIGIQTYVFVGTPTSLYTLPTEKEKFAYLSVTADGVRLIEGLHFTMSAVTTGDVEQMVVTLLITMPQTLVAMVYTQRPASEPQRWAALSNRWSLSMMGDATETLLSPQGYRTGYRMNGTWDLLRWPDGAATRLTHDVFAATEEITVEVNPFNVAADLVPENPLPLPGERDSGKEPGAAWLNGERIEYFKLVRNGNLITISELRRGARGTRIGVEQRSVAVFTGNGSLRTFRLANATVQETIEVAVRGVDGHSTGQSSPAQYDFYQDGNDVVVTLNVAPVSGESVYLAQSRNTMHVAGTILRAAGTAENYGPREPGSPFGGQNPAPRGPITYTGGAPDSVFTGPPEIGSPVLAQFQNVGTNSIVTSSPQLGTPLLRQTHRLTGSGMTASGPVLGSPTMTSARPTNVLTATSLVAGSPQLDVPAFTTSLPGWIPEGADVVIDPVNGQYYVSGAVTYALTALGLTTGSPGVGDGA